MFSALGNDISALEIDIAHRVQQRAAVTNSGRPTRPNPIVCKFTRRLTRDTVLASRSNSGQLTAEALGFPPTSIVNRILIFPHLTPRLQDEGTSECLQLQMVLGPRNRNFPSQDRHTRSDLFEIN